MDDTCKIRFADPEDAPALAALYAVSFARSSHSANPTCVHRWVEERSSSSWAQLVSDQEAIVRVAERKGICVGFTVTRDADSDPLTVELEHIAVLPELADIGVEQALLADVDARYAPDRELLATWVLDGDNDTAALLADAGWWLDRRPSRLVDCGEAALRWQRWLRVLSSPSA